VRPLVALAAALVLAPAGAAGQEWIEMTTARQVAGVDSLTVDVVYGAGRLRVGPADEDLLYRARMRYDASAFRPVREFERTGDGARVRLGVEGGGGVEDLGLDADLDWDFSDLSPFELRDLEGMNAGRGGSAEMEVGLPGGVPTDLRLRIGAAESTMELGGLPLRRLRIATGASETVVSFDRPNPSVMEELQVKAGAASLEIRGLGHARARHIEVENAVGEVTLDLSGRWAGDATASVKTGVGTVTLRIPADLGVKVDQKTFLGSFSGLGLDEAGDGSYRSENWETADHRLELEVEAALGSIDLERTP
jgi:hypothetical protein